MEKTAPELMYFGVSRFQSNDAIYHIQYGNLQAPFCNTEKLAADSVQISSDCALTLRLTLLYWTMNIGLLTAVGWRVFVD
jgi:hypothetical protein